MDDEADLRRGKNKEYWVGATAYTPKTTMLLTECEGRAFGRSPQRAKHLLRSISAGVGEFDLRASQRGRTLAGGSPFLAL